MRGLARLFDVATGVVPVDLNTGDGATGKRLAVAGFSAVDVLVFLGAAASGTDDTTINVKQHTAYVSGTSNDLDTAAVSTSSGITEWFIKHEATLDNDEAWERVTQSDSSTITLTGATYAPSQCIVAFTLRGSQLGTDYTHISVDLGHTANVARLGGVLYVPHGLRYSRRPDKLGNLLRPGAADA
jgi:hypothetical protein